MVHAMTAEERPAWAARLQAEREARGWNKAEMARRLRRARGHPRGPTASLVRQILDWEKGKNLPRDWRQAYATAFELDDQDPKTNHRIEVVFTDGADDSAEP